MTAPPPLNPLPPLCEMARLWVSMAADGEVSEVERAALEEHIDVCEDCTEWRALAEAVVLHVRTTPPSPVPAGLLPRLHHGQETRRDGTRGRRPHVQHDCLGEGAPLRALLAVLQVLAERGDLDLTRLAVSGRGDPQTRHLAERRAGMLGAGCSHERVERRARSISKIG